MRATSIRFGSNDHDSHDHSHHNVVDSNGLKWDLIFELNGETRHKNKISGATEDNSGGITVFLSPGIRVSLGVFSSFLSYGIPVVEDQNGKQTDIDKRIVAGISLAF